MFPASYKSLLKKMRHYNAKKKAMQRPFSTLAIGTMLGEASTALNMEEDGELDLPVLPSTYFECQKGIGEWVDRAKTFSPSSKNHFQQWAKGTEICLAEAQLQ